VFTPVRLVRFWFPLVLIVVGFAMLIISPDIVGIEGFALMIGGGLGVIVSNRIHRMGLAGEKDRDAEFDARAFFDRYGVWPDEATEEQLETAARDRDLHRSGPSSAPTTRRTRRP
jgi:hypothetical protein